MSNIEIYMCEGPQAGEKIWMPKHTYRFESTQTVDHDDKRDTVTYIYQVVGTAFGYKAYLNDCFRVRHRMSASGPGSVVTQLGDTEQSKPDGLFDE